MAMRHPLHMFGSHSRLFLCAAGAAALYPLLPGAFDMATRLLIVWNAGVIAFLALTGLAMRKATHESMRRKAEQEDASAPLLLFICVAAAGASLGAIVVELGLVKNLDGFEKGCRVGLASATILTSWFFIHGVFTLHYAREYFACMKRGHPPGLRFPDDDEPDYSDFLYFSYIIGVAAQTADVSITSRPIRRLATLHGIIAFFYNATILALTVNIGAGFI